MPPVNWKDHFINFISVILGVTLAFLINSIASSYKQQQEMKLIVLSILEEIQEDIAAYEEYQIPYNKLIIEDIEKTLALIEENGNKDSLQFHFSKAMDVNNYSPSNVTFNSMISSGKLDLLGNFYLRKNLYNYSLSAEEAKIKGIYQADFLLNKIVPWTIENNDVFAKENAEKELNQLGGLLGVYKELIQGKINQYETIVEYGKEIKKELEKL